MSLHFVAVLCMTTMVAADVLVLPLGVIREFVCTSPPEEGYVIAWLVNSTSAESSQLPYIAVGGEVQSEDGGVQRSINFTSDIAANDTHLRCIVSSFRADSHISVDLNLTLQGYLPPPNVTYDLSKDRHSVMFSWSAPFTLNISDMEPDILHYVVYIISDDGHNDTVTTTDTHYELQADPCQSHQYHVEIAAVNVVGEGEKYISSQISLEGFAIVIVSNTTVSFKNKIVGIEMTVEVSPDCLEEEVIDYVVELNATYSNDELLFKSSGDVGIHTISFASPAITMNELYDCSVRIEGLPHSGSVRMNLSTFDVQYANVTTNKQNSMFMDITCYFAEGSDAIGCNIIVETLHEYNASCEFLAFRDEDNEATVTVALPSGSYTLLVYDYEAEADDNSTFATTLFVQSSAEVSVCTTRLSDENMHSTLETNVILIVILVSSGILMVVITTLIISIGFCKHKGKTYVTSNVEENDYSDHKSVPEQPCSSLSSQFSSSSETSSGSDPLDRSIGSQSTSPLVPESGHAHYADIQVTVKQTMTHPPPAPTTEPVNYATVQHQDTRAHSNQLQRTVNGHLPGPYTTDDKG